MSHVAYCPACSVSLGRRALPLEEVRDQAQLHARVTGHVVQIVTEDTWTVVESVAGEAALPLWDESP